MVGKAWYLSLAVAALADAQPTFEVASIKPNAASDNRVVIRIQPGGRFTATGVTAKDLLGQALGVREFQILNAPGWASAERWDINAVAEGRPERVTPEVLRPMLLSLLTDRFQLKTHTETKELPMYLLVAAKGGPKLKKSEAVGDRAPRMIRMGRGQLNAQGVPLSVVTQQLGQVLGREVADRTGLEGNFDFELNWTPEPGQGGGGPMGGPPSPDALPAAGSSGPSLFTAVQEQLGLRLEPARGPVRVYVVDQLSRPSEN